MKLLEHKSMKLKAQVEPMHQNLLEAKEQNTKLEMEYENINPSH
jgi:regulator of replication initiation timing